MASTQSTKARHGITSAAAPTPLSAELLDSLAVFRPIEEVTLEIGTDQVAATLARVVKVDAAGDPHDLGERPIFWVVVREQLATATQDMPWVAGTLGQAGRAFRLRPLDAAELKRVERALDQLPI